MIIERTKDEVIIRLPATLDTKDLEEMVNFLRFKEITATSKASEHDIKKLNKDVKKGRWAKQRAKLLGE
ncbi:hypothetical protein RT717_02930 [Imperialibacter roseus]|uniref:Uncharacterized protein n=1 Tax=Imperialibacter roseus TaxID=1324217 RepID=A0ABZ0IRC5_9BACT|nr:hypothetical protein [Imperialibacter roseus]WOK07575.1 hypothetical protein RT717_02930 [Imperialibacter roseus]